MSNPNQPLVGDHIAATGAIEYAIGAQVKVFTFGGRLPARVIGRRALNSVIWCYTLQIIEED